MPTYDYVCDACGHAFEEFQSMTARPLRKCPSCGKIRLKRLIGTGAAVIFKGSGFYETDYRSESYKKGEKAEAEAAKPKVEAEKKSDSGGKSGTEKSAPKSDKSAKAAKGEKSGKAKTSDPA